MGIDIGGAAVLTSPSGTTLSLDDGPTNWMQVNANGILTRPQTPYMRGDIVGRGSTYNASGGALLVASDVNVGNCWNNTTGLWTCPVAGYYLIAFFSICGPAGSGYPHIQKNGSTQRHSHWNFSGGSWHCVTLSCIVLCAASDTLRWIIASPSPAAAGVHGNTNHAMYSIALLA